MDIMLQVHMSSSESSGLSEEHDPMVIVFEDEISPAPEIFTSDSEIDPELMSDDDDPDDFQPFALPNFGDDIPFIDDILAFPLPIHDQLIIGHPDDEHLVDHLDDDLGDGEVFDIAILDVASPVVSVIDISSDSDHNSVVNSFESVTFSALLAAGLGACPTDDDDDAMSVAPSSPVHIPTPTDTPPHTPTHVASDSSSRPHVPTGHSSGARSIRYASGFPHTPPTHGGEPSGHPHIAPPELSPHVRRLDCSLVFYDII
ncbi:hypothetical protein Hanom_Chr16g01459431 [Helianthus anomalus]